MTADLQVWQLVALAAFGLVGGVGITAVGPGGVLPTIGMFVLTGLSPATVAGTAIVTHVATGMAGTVAYQRSGQLREPGTRRVAAILAGTAAVGTPVGVLVNAAVSGRAFGVLLGAAVTVTGLLVWLRRRRGGRDERHPPVAVTAAIGLTVAVAAGLFGLGGPLLSVPLLVVCGLPVLRALAAAQVQSVVVAAVGTVGYVLHGSVDWVLAAVIGVPELAGVLVGWRIARAVPARRLEVVLAAALVVVGPYLALRG